MTIQEVYDYYWRNWSEATRCLGMGKNSYQYWKKIGYIPMPTQKKIEKATNGRLVADINKESNAR